MSEKLLEINGLKAEAAGKEILGGVDLSIGEGEVHVLMGPNGAGKSTLGNVLMGDPSYQVTDGKILLNGKDITSESIEARAAAGLFLSFQAPVEIPGVTVADLIRTAAEQRSGKRIFLADFRKKLYEKMDFLQMDRSWAQREVNVGFSGGERKKCEILQLLMLEPTLAILDETDSGLDVDAVRTVSSGVKAFCSDGKRSLLVITHSARILEELDVDRTHVLVDGRIVSEGDASLASSIISDGFARFEKANEDPA